MNITGNMAAGQVSGDTAKNLSEKIGKIRLFIIFVKTGYSQFYRIGLINN